MAANPDVTYDYYYNEQWQLLEERKNGDTDPLSQYVWHPYYIDALAVRYWDYNTDGDYLDNYEGDQYFLHDANFNITAVMNASGTVLERYHYSPYGEVTYLAANFAYQTPFLDNNHLYTGRERDGETGLQLNRRRFYHAQLGRWVSRDPVGYQGGTLNLFEYAYSKALAQVDPLGTVCALSSSTVGPWSIPVANGGYFSSGIQTNPGTINVELTRQVRCCHSRTIKTVWLCQNSNTCPSLWTVTDLNVQEECWEMYTKPEHYVHVGGAVLPAPLPAVPPNVPGLGGGYYEIIEPEDQAKCNRLCKSSRPLPSNTISITVTPPYRLIPPSDAAPPTATQR